MDSYLVQLCTGSNIGWNIQVGDSVSYNVPVPPQQVLHIEQNFDWQTDWNRSQQLEFGADHNQTQGMDSHLN